MDGVQNEIATAIPTPGCTPARIKALPFYDIVVKNLTYKVAIKAKKSKGKTQNHKVLLNGINAEAFHGQTLAIVGPSGSGKTIFLDALAGHLEQSSLEGEIYVNGELVDSSFRRISGYVMQDDALFPMLTVRETLLYSARLRLSSSMPLAEKKLRVNDIIKQLGLAKCADTRVGNEKIRGVSGGERRRVSIGSDLIHNPPVLLLDEPTSGLDSRAALNIMENLKRMAQLGRRTVLLTIHQPSYRILDTIDRVLVLGRGNVIYHGTPGGIKHYFDPLGRSMPESVNVIEYVIDIIQDYDETSSEGLAPLISLQALNKIQLDTIEDGHRPSEGPSPPHLDTGEDRSPRMVRSSDGLSTLLSLQIIVDGLRSSGGVSTPITLSEVSKTKSIDGLEMAPGTLGHEENKEAETPLEYATSKFLPDCFVLSSRNFKNIQRTPELFVSRIAVMLIGSITVGTLFYNAKEDEDGVRQRLSFFAFALALLVFTSIDGIGHFIEERRIFIRERSRGAYGASSYVISGAVVSIPSLLILAMVFAATSYFMVGLAPTPGAFFFFVLVLWLTLCVANSFVCFISSMVPNFTIGSALFSGIMAYSFLFSGFFIKRTAIPKYWIWMHYLAIFKYPYESLIQNEIGNKIYANVTWGALGSSENFLISISDGAVHQWVNILVMILFVFFYRVLMCVGLKYFNKCTRK